MFWRLNGSLNSSSTLEATLDRALNGNHGDNNSGGGGIGGGGGDAEKNVVDELLEEQDLLSELKAQNQRLIQVLSSKESVKSLLAWSIYGTDEIERRTIALEERAVERVLEQVRAEAELGEEEAAANTGAGAAASTSTSTSTPPTLTPSTSTSTSLTSLPSDPSISNNFLTKRSRHPQIATEVLCADIWSINEVVCGDLEGNLRGMWEVVLGSREEGLGMSWEGFPLEGEGDEEGKGEGSSSSSSHADSDPASNKAQPSESKPQTSNGRSTGIGMNKSQTNTRPHAFNINENKEAYRARVRYELEKLKGEQEEEDERRREVLRGNWSRINQFFMAKRPGDMIAFLKKMPNVVEKLVDRMTSNAVQDLICRVIACEENGVVGTVEWLANEHFISRIFVQLSPYHPPPTHYIMTEMVKAVTILSSPNSFNPNQGSPAEQQTLTSPSATNGAGGSNTGGGETNGVQAQAPGGVRSEFPSQQGGQGLAGPPQGSRDNRLLREMVKEDNIRLLVEPIWRSWDTSGRLPGRRKSGELVDVDLGNGEKSSSAGESGQAEAGKERQQAYTFDPYDLQPLPSVGSVTSSLTHSIAILIELIRKNNSDYSEPYLFHAIRNRLMGMQQRKVEERHKEDQERGGDDMEKPDETSAKAQEREQADRQEMEEAMEEMSSKMGIVHLGSLLEQVGEHIGLLQDLLEKPRNASRISFPSVPNPLGLERFRVIELYAEMLHCSNMSILNRPAGSGPIYSDDGCLQGGLDALEELGQALENTNEQGETAEEINEVTPARDLPVSSAGSTATSAAGSDDGKEEEEHEELPPIAEEEEGTAQPSAGDEPKAIQINTDVTPGDEAEEEPSTPKQSTYDDLSRSVDQLTLGAAADPADKQNTDTARRETDPPLTKLALNQLASDIEADSQVLPPGDRLKRLYLHHDVLPVVLDLFFEFPSNNFLHNVVYDVVQQILNGKLTPGLNREAVVVLFQKGKIAERVLHTQKVNDQMSGGRRSKRLGLMGHMLLVADEIDKFLQRCQPDLWAEIGETFNSTEWKAFSEGEMRESRARDAQPLGGGRPSAIHRPDRNKTESDSSDDEDEVSGPLSGQPLTRAASSGEAFSSAFGFGTAEAEDGKYRNFTRYLVNDTYSGSFASSDEDSDSGSESPRAAHKGEGRQKMLSDGFDDAFSPSSEPEDDDAWGDFASASGGRNTGDADDDDDDPFGDSFAESQPRHTSMSIHANRPMTAADFANQAFEDQYSRESSESRSGQITVPSNAMGDDSFESAAEFLAANWSVPGGQFGEDLPPTHTEEFNPDPILDTSSPSSYASTISPSSSPERSIGLHPAAKIGRRRSSSKSLAISPPEPSLVRATDPGSPLGHGVSPDTTVRDDGKLERRMSNGQKVTAPQDDIAVAASHARKNSR